MEKLISVIIPVYNQHKELDRCLDALESQLLSRELYEIIIVDNGSVPSISSEHRRSDGIRVIREKTPGSYAARNKGIREATSQYIAFTDADCVPAEQWLQEGIRAIKAAEGAVVGGAVRMFLAPGNDRTGPALYDLCLGLRQEKYWNDQRFLITANLFTTIEVIEKVGLFRTDVFSGADVEWSRRAANCGVDLQYAPRAVVWHPVRAKWGALREKVLRIAEGASDAGYRKTIRSHPHYRRGVWSKFRVGMQVLRSSELQSWRERLKVFVVAVIVVAWSVEGRIQYRLRGKRSR